MNSQRETIFGQQWAPVTAALVTLIALAAFNILAPVGGIPQITAELGNVDLLGWLVTGFLLTSTLATMAVGPLIDAVGVRKTFRVTIVVFAAGSVACALAPTMLALVAFRALQGVGAGLAFAVAAAAIGLGFPERLRPRVLATTSITWGVMALAGPALGAALVSTTGWRGIFVATLPIAALAAVLGWHRLPDRSADAQTTERFGGDLKGMILLGAFTVVSLVGLASLNATALWAIAVATVLALGYWIYSGRVKSPVLARRHFSQMPLGAINVCFGLAFGAALGIDAYLPVYVRGGLGGSEDMAAFSVAFLTVGWTLGSIVSTRLLRRYTERTVSLLGFGTLIPPFVVGLSLYDRMTPLALVFTMAATVGLGVGLQSMSMQSLLYARAATSEVGRASSAHQYLRGLFQTYSAALCGAILLLVVRDRVGEVEEVRRLLNGEAVSGEEVAGAVAYGFRLAHIVPLAFALIGAGIALLLGRHEALPWRRVPAGLVTPAPAAPTRAMDE